MWRARHARQRHVAEQYLASRRMPAGRGRWQVAQRRVVVRQWWDWQVREQKRASRRRGWNTTPQASQTAATRPPFVRGVAAAAQSWAGH